MNVYQMNWDELGAVISNPNASHEDKKTASNAMDEMMEQSYDSDYEPPFAIHCN